ncbi:MAG: hypothetical protein KF712_04420 [Akkermansiaceae bacterium]|nr:hypothetical protein [Akkermansiaceae bacterium]
MAEAGLRGQAISGHQPVPHRLAELFRHTMRQSVTSTWLAGAKEFARGTLGEVGEEVLIEALDTAFVRMSLNPDMTVGEFFKSLHDTALVTAFTSAPSSAVHGANAVRDVRDVRGSKGVIEGETKLSEPVGPSSGEPMDQDAATSPVPEVINHSNATNASKGRITIHERDENVVVSSFEGDAGEARIVAEMIQDGDTLILRGVHIEGKGTLKEALEAARNFGREQGAKRVIIEGGRRTTGAKPGHIPKPLSIDTGL